jgi:hypothetical protein
MRLYFERKIKRFYLINIHIIYLKKFNVEITILEANFEDILHTGTVLGGIQLPDSKILKNLKKDIKNFKCLFDNGYLIERNISSWEDLYWESANMENIITEATFCLKELNNCADADKDTKNWTMFNEIKIKLENFINSLKFLTILKNAAIESHHWTELMKIYKTFKDTDIIDLNDETKLKDLIKLGLNDIEASVN